MARGQKAIQGIRKDGSLVKRVSGRAAIAVLNPETVKEWDDEELERGQQRSKDGSFRGRPPQIIPKACHDELTRRRFRQAIELFKKHSVEAVTILGKIMNDEKAEDRDRINAAKLILERVIPARIDISSSIEEPKWLEALKGAIVPGDAKDEDDDGDIIIEVESREAS